MRNRLLPKLYGKLYYYSLSNCYWQQFWQHEKKECCKTQCLKAFLFQVTKIKMLFLWLFATWSLFELLMKSHSMLYVAENEIDQQCWHARQKSPPLFHMNKYLKYSSKIIDFGICIMRLQTFLWQNTTCSLEAFSK